MILLPKSTVLPLYAQVAILDPSVPDAYPEYQDPPGEAVAGPHGVVVYVRPDHLGDVTVEVRQGEASCAGADRMILETELKVQGSEGLVVGNVAANNLYPLTVSPGEHRVRVYVVGPIQAPTAVCFVIDPT